MVGVEPTYPEDGNKRVAFGYDYMGRRVSKSVQTYTGTHPTGSWGAAVETRFVWDGWLMVEELYNAGSAGTPNWQPRRKFTYGLDLAGLNGSTNDRASAGGIGGLLAVEESFGTTSTDDDKNYLYCYDGNGNVGQVIDWADNVGSASGPAWDTARLAATYEYDPYGRVTASGGVTTPSDRYDLANPIRFSTKYWDDETGLGYWGYRYYDPKQGRWISRDPIGEAGGANVVRAFLNRPDVFDPHGLEADCCDTCGPDITKALLSSMSRVRATLVHLRSNHRALFFQVCNGIVGAANWDYMTLASRTAIVQGGGCGTGQCAGTVWVGTGCWDAAQVNYALWGMINCVCGRNPASVIGISELRKSVLFPRPPGAGQFTTSAAWATWGMALGGCAAGPDVVPFPVNRAWGAAPADGEAWDPPPPRYLLWKNPHSHCTSCLDSSGNRVVWNGALNPKVSIGGSTVRVQSIEEILGTSWGAGVLAGTPFNLDPWEQLPEKYRPRSP